MENENKEVLKITWQGIGIEIICCEPDYYDKSPRNIWLWHVSY